MSCSSKGVRNGNCLLSDFGDVGATLAMMIDDSCATSQANPRLRHFFDSNREDHSYPKWATATFLPNDDLGKVLLRAAYAPMDPA
jgi:hypothetical protein